MVITLIRLISHLFDVINVITINMLVVIDLDKESWSVIQLTFTCTWYIRNICINKKYRTTRLSLQIDDLWRNLVPCVPKNKLSWIIIERRWYELQKIIFKLSKYLRYDQHNCCNYYIWYVLCFCLLAGKLFIFRIQLKGTFICNQGGKQH
jgi:hypothetical protein